jgi:hypothetical protein
MMDPHPSKGWMVGMGNLRIPPLGATPSVLTRVGRGIPEGHTWPRRIHGSRRSFRAVRQTLHLIHLPLRRMRGQRIPLLPFFPAYLGRGDGCHWGAGRGSPFDPSPPQMREGPEFPPSPPTWGRVGKKVVNMSIDQAGGQYWLKLVNTGPLKILWSI